MLSSRLDPPPPSSDSTPVASENVSGTELLNKFLEASNRELAGDLEQAWRLYEEVIALDETDPLAQSARKALDNLLRHPAIAPRPEAPTQIETLERIPLELPPTVSLPQGVRSWWGSLDVRTKLGILLVTTTVIPVVATTQASVWITQATGQQDFQQAIQADLKTLEEEYVLRLQQESLADAETLAGLIQANGIDPNNPALVKQYQGYLNTLLQRATTASDRSQPEYSKSFWAVTDLRGVTVAQVSKLQVEKTDAAGYPRLPAPPADNQRPSPEFTNPVIAAGQPLGDLPIVKQALQQRRSLEGIEVVPQGALVAMGLGEQAVVKPRGSSAPAAPTGLVAMAVYPVMNAQSQVVGTTIVGALLNRNHALIDHAHQNHQIPILSIYSESLRVTTNIPFDDTATGTTTDTPTRAVGTVASPEVINSVLIKGNSTPASERIQRIDYRTLSQPLYDHQKLFSPNAKPVGIITIGRPETELNQLLARQQFIGFSIGAIVLSFVALVAIPVANGFAFSLRNLARFAQQIGGGVGGTRLQATERRDEIGILSEELNLMAGSIETSMEQIRSREAQERQEAERQRREKEALQTGVVDLLLQIEGAQKGDLTVQAPVTYGEVGSIADAFNATIRSLRQIVIQVKSVTNQVKNLAENSETLVSQLSEQSQNQSTELDQALRSISAITDLSAQVAQSTQETATIARQAADAAQRGDAAMSQTVVSMDKIRTAVSNTAKQAKRLAESSQEISQILAIITGISEKANLLAFNAAIEAARAGEQGAGFRQVAEEVRGLAQQVTESAQDIEVLISSIQEETAAVLDGMEVGTSEVVTGTQLVNQTKQTLQGLTELSQQINQFMQAIALNTAEQTNASLQVNQRMDFVSQIAVTTSHEAQSVATALQSLVSQVQALQASVARFQVE